MSATLDPQARQFLDAFAASGTPMPWEVATPAEARAVLESLQVVSGEPIPVGRVDERSIATPIGALRVRIFTPPGEGPFPVVLWFHGGGWVVGSLDESDATCRSLCSKANAIVVCPDYRLAPEHPFPAAADDCYATTKWVANHGRTIGGNSSAIAVAGDSAGGNLAAVVAQMARDRGGPELVFQLLVYPVVGLPNDGRSSYAEFSDGFFLTKAGMEWFADQYATSADDLRNPYLTPLGAGNLSQLPPALVITAECDPLRDEGEEYARRLQQAGVECTLSRYGGQIHAFFVLLEDFDAALAAHQEAADALRAAFDGAELPVTPAISS
jgi:acetyl esterase